MSVESMMRRVGMLVMTVMVVMAGTAAGQPPAAAPAPTPTPANTGELAVTITYKGAGDVKPGNEVSIFLFDTPTINAESNPIGMQTVEKNSGVATFTNLPPTVYIAVVYDEKGVYDQQGPPPSGTPTKIHSGTDGVAIGVPTGKDKKVTVTFDDTVRMP
jgi:hypothetical protein